MPSLDDPAGDAPDQQAPIDLNDDRRLALVIAEFNDRRTEVNNRTTMQQVLFRLNVAAAGVIVTLGLRDEGSDRSLLLLLGPICSSLAMLWANHARTIRHIGWYIRWCLRPLVAPTQEDRLWRWEIDHDTFQDQRRKHRRTFAKLATFVLPMMLTFIGPAVFGAWASHGSIMKEGGAQTKVLYWIVVAFTAYGAAVLGHALLEPEQPEPRLGSPCRPKRDQDNAK